MKRNVLHFILDDLSPEHARTPARTPHIDGLAARGVRFGSAFCQFALCSPSRQSFFTGRSVNDLRAFDFGEWNAGGLSRYRKPAMAASTARRRSRGGRGTAEQY